jgi:hypothetical protein
MATSATPPASSAEEPVKLQSSPVHAALWSHPHVGRKTRPPPMASSLIGCSIGFCLLLLEMATEEHGEGILSSHNGMLMKFFKSLHAINHCEWPHACTALLLSCACKQLLKGCANGALAADYFATRYVSRSLIGCFILKFVGSSLVSLSLGRVPSWTDNPSHCISFLIAFSLVRSDSLEARELSGHMRYAAPASVALNLIAALYKMRALSHLINEASFLGHIPTLLVGTLAFSTCKLLMAVEFWVLEYAHSKSSADAVGLEAVKAPAMRQTLARHFAYLFLLLIGKETNSRLAYSLAKVAVLGALFAKYNEGLLHQRGEHDANTGSLTRSGSSYILSTLHIPPAAKPVPSSRPGVPSSESWLGMGLVWLISIITIRHTPASHTASSSASEPRGGTSLLMRSEAPRQSSSSMIGAQNYGQGVGLRQRISVPGT